MRRLVTALAIIAACVGQPFGYLSRTEIHSDDKWYVEKYKVYFNLIWLLAEIGGGGGT